MNEDRFDPRSKRAQMAKIRNALDKLIVVFGLATGLAAGGWLYLVFGQKVAAGWLLLGLAAALLILILWVKLGIRHIPVGPTEEINDLLSGDAMLALLKGEEPSALAQRLLKGSKSGRFLGLRMGLSAGMIEEMRFAPMGRAFQRARETREETMSQQIGGGDLLAGMILAAENGEEVLKRKGLEPEDLFQGIKWFNYLNNLAREAKKPIRTGGVARDLNFGYIPTLTHFGQNISSQAGRWARSQIYYTDRGEALERMIQIFSGRQRQNVALIGPEGSGRSLVVKAFAEELLDEESKIPRGLKYRQVFKLDAGALLAAGNGARGNLERILTKIFNEAYAAKNIILYLNDAQLFFSDGVGAVDLTNFLLPVIEAGRIRIILSVEEQEFLRISARNSGVANMFNRVNIKPTGQEETMRVAEDQVPVFEGRFGVRYTYAAMKEAYRLGDRYITDRAEPGRTLRMLEISAEYAEGKMVTEGSVRTAVEQALGVKVKVASGANDREKLLNMEEEIARRVVGQKSAVKTVSNALRRAAAGVRNEGRPIGTFLFLGPTGVGKTELAKAVSEVYFHGEGQIVRLDLNEYVGAESVEKLIADPARDEKSLTAQVMKRPFSLVLLDEIEKAHPKVLTALLQVLDEGVLRDEKNNEVNFRDTIIIATSNAGAGWIREKVAQGEEMTAKEMTDRLIESGEFKAEFLNRFDEVCVFEPLGKEELSGVAELMVKGVNKTLATQKIEVRLTEGAIRALVERGYDPQLGARPMRRVIQKTVEDIAARAILEGKVETGGVVEVTEEMVAEA